MRDIPQLTLQVLELLSTHRVAGRRLWLRMACIEQGYADGNSRRGQRDQRLLKSCRAQLLRSNIEG